MIRSIRSILVPLDGSPVAEQAIPFAEAIAQQARAKLKLVLIHVPNQLIEPGPGYVKVELATQKVDREYLKSVHARVRERLGRAVSSAVVLGSPIAQTLARYSKELGADLIVMTTHGRGGLRRAWLGSVTDQLIRTAEIPIMVIRPAEEGTAQPVFAAREILVPLDGSPLAEAALEPAVALAQLWDAKVSLVQVVRPVILTDAPHVTFPSGYSNLATTVRRDSAQDYAQNLAEHLRESGVKANGAAVIGGPVPETIIDLATPERVALLVVATHGRGGMKRLMLGSVADKLIRDARVPVLVVRPVGRRAGRKAADPRSAHAYVLV